MELKKIREMSEAELNSELVRPLSEKKNLLRFRTNGKEDGLWQLKETEERQESAW